MAFKMMGGKPLKQKTGAGIPIQMKSALYQRDMLTRVKDGVMAGIKGFDAEPKVTVGGQGAPGSGSRKGNRDLIEMSRNAIKAASEAFEKKDPKPVVTKTSPGRQMKKGGPKQQNSKSRLDERLGMKDGAEKDKLQSMTSRRNESAAMQKKPKKKGGMKQMDKKAPAKQNARQKANLPAKLVKIISNSKAKKGAPKQKMKAGMKQMDKKGGPKEYGKGPKQKESVKQEKKDLDINFLAEKMEPKTK